jgi:hypothetical protein
MNIRHLFLALLAALSGANLSAGASSYTLSVTA